MPKRGAANAANVIALPDNPIIGEIEKTERTEYNAAKQAVSATRLVACLFLRIKSLFTSEI